MNQILQWLTGGDLRSDGRANEVANLVCDRPALMSDLLEGLSESDEVVRARAADALEKVSRTRPDLFSSTLPRLLAAAKKDALPMARWHAAMMLTNLAMLEEKPGLITATLTELLDDPSAFVRSWAIAGLCVIGRKYTRKRKRILKRLSALRQDKSIAVRHRATTAIRLLVNDWLPLPGAWIKIKKFGGL